MAWRPLYAKAWVIFFLNNILKPKITKTCLSKFKNKKKKQFRKTKTPPTISLDFFNFYGNSVI
jgi:hypothetical protein